MAALVAGCEVVPRVMEPGAAPPGLALLPQDRAGIVVDPVGGVSEPFATDMAREVVEGLIDANVPASLGRGAAQSYRLKGSASMVDRGNGMMQLYVDWALRDPAGALVGQFEDNTLAPRESPETAGYLADLARDAAPRLAALIQDEVPVSMVPVAAPAGGVTVAVGPITGAPGTGSDDLMRAVRGNLPLFGMRIVDDAAVASHRLTGEIAVGPVSNGAQSVSLTWRLLDAAGEELGRLDQDNQVAAGSLDGSWAGVASVIAEGVAGGVAQILAQTGAL